MHDSFVNESSIESVILVNDSWARYIIDPKDFSGPFNPKLNFTFYLALYPNIKDKIF